MAAGFGGRFYAVGKKGQGVVLVFFDPMKVFTISQRNIIDSADLLKINEDEMFKNLCQACNALTREYRKGAQVSEADNWAFMNNVNDMGMSFSNTEFAVTGEVDVESHTDEHHRKAGLVAIRRKSPAVLHEAIARIQALSKAINDGTISAPDAPTEIKLDLKQP
jgi:hypothetical protein